MVQASLDHYNAAYGRCKTRKDAREHGVSHAHNRVSWLAALDWVWNDLEPGARDSLASGMINSVQKHLELFPDVRSRCLWEKMDYLRAGKYGSIPFWSEIWSPVDNAQRARLPEDLPLARHIRILDARDVLVDRELTQQIMPQAGLALTR